MATKVCNLQLMTDYVVEGYYHPHYCFAIFTKYLSSSKKDNNEYLLIIAAYLPNRHLFYFCSIHALLFGEKTTLLTLCMQVLFIYY